MNDKMITLVNCYVERRDERIKNYIELFKKFGNIEVIYDENFLPSPDSRAYIISGSEKYVSRNEFKPELFEFLRKTDLPLIGICYGHHLIAKAYGARVSRGKETIKRDFRKNPELIRVLKDEQIFTGLSKVFLADESHKDHVIATEEFKENFEIIASSNSCSVEAIKHRRKPIFGFQFHLERSGKSGEIIARNFFRLVDGGKYG